MSTVDHIGAGCRVPEEFKPLSGALEAMSVDHPSEVRVLSATLLGEGVHRLVLHGATCASLVVKRLRGKRAHLEHRVTDRWLPAVGLGDLGPPRRATIGEAEGEFVWHLYDDLGPCGLDRQDFDLTSVALAMDRLADLHASFAGHPLLAEPRFAAGDLGTHFYVNSVRDAARCVGLLRPTQVPMSAQDERVRNDVLALLFELIDDEPRRVHLLRAQAGPETLVHGDLTRANVFVLPREPQVCLIDWDHVGVAPAAFDISTHVAHYPLDQRRLVLERYLGAMEERGLPFPHDVDWDLLVATFEAGRLANQLIWMALGIIEGNGWTFRELAAWSEDLAAAVRDSRHSSAGLA